jgi:hypothetical protein
MLIETFNKSDVWQVRGYDLLKYIIKLNISGNDKRNLFYNKIKACLIAYCYHWFIVIIRFLLSISYCYHSVLVIIQLLLSDVAWPNVITLSRTFCSLKISEEEFFETSKSIFYSCLFFFNFMSLFFL